MNDVVSWLGNSPLATLIDDLVFCNSFFYPPLKLKNSKTHHNPTKFTKKLIEINRNSPHS